MKYLPKGPDLDAKKDRLAVRFASKRLAERKKQKLLLYA